MLGNLIYQDLLTSFLVLVGFLGKLFLRSHIVGPISYPLWYLKAAQAEPQRAKPRGVEDKDLSSRNLSWSQVTWQSLCLTWKKPWVAQHCVNKSLVPEIPELGRLRQEGQRFKVHALCLGYLGSWCYWDLAKRKTERGGGDRDGEWKDGQRMDRWTGWSWSCTPVISAFCIL